MKKPEQIKLNLDEIDTLMQRVETGHLQDGDYEIIKSMADTIVCLNQALENKKVSIKRLLKMLFGSKTEKKDKILKNNDSGSSDNLEGKESPSDDKSDTCDNPDKTQNSKPDKKSKGHGRTAADKYTGADREFIFHPELKHKDPCPLCPKGKVYKLKIPGVVVRISAQAPLQATISDLEKLRCNLCGEVFTAKAPGNITGKHYDETAKAMIAILKYGCGFPWYRMEKLQESLGVPLPASTQWDKTESAADLIYPAFNELKRQAAQGNILHNDDTPMKILELMKENKTRDKKDRTGIFTSGIISVLDEDRKVALFFTGRNHAGENIGSLYQIRDQEKGPPIQMCDALSRNSSTQFEIIMANCLTHGRRGFVDVVESFPDECRYVIETLAEVYKIDDKTKKQSMSSEERLEFHQLHSAPLMEKLGIWFNKQIDDKLVEPNSGLGQAITYMLKHWPELTRFLHVPGAPLDNNICEQALKRAILHRKNAMFYKTQHGAYIGDLFMSLIHTCNLMKINPFRYLVALQKYSASLFKDPSRWMPWNYETALAMEV
jgi:transposase